MKTYFRFLGRLIIIFVLATSYFTAILFIFCLIMKQFPFTDVKAWEAVNEAIIGGGYMGVMSCVVVLYDELR